MIEICVWRRSDGRAVRLSVSGHAGQAPRGEDIVCAAASALVETLSLGLREVVHQPAVGPVEDGQADLRFAADLSGEGQAVVNTIAYGLKDLARTVPDAVRYHEERLP